VFTINLIAKNIYVIINTGYQLNMSSQNIQDFYSQSVVNNSYIYEQVDVGKGFNIGATVGNMFNNNLGAELNILTL
jgi:hypothetical protein